MRNKKIFILLLAIALVIGGLAGCGTTGDKNSSEDATSEFGVLKNFSAQTLDGGTFTQDDLKAVDVTIINFWTTSCPPCLAEMPALGNIAASLPENVKMVTMCFDGATNKTSAEEILSDAKFNSATLIGGDGDFAKVCGKIQYTPTTLFVDSQGNISSDVIIGGAETEEILKSEIYARVNAVLKSLGKPEIK